MLADCLASGVTHTVGSLCTGRTDRWIKVLLCCRGFLSVCLNEGELQVPDGVILGLGEGIIV